MVARGGIKLGSISTNSQAAALELMKTVLSADGYSDLEGIRAADEYLGTMQSGYGADLYYIGIFGTPSAKAFIFRFLREIGDFIMLPRRIMKSTLHYNEDSLGLAICRKVCEQWTGACICTKGSTL